MAAITVPVTAPAAASPTAPAHRPRLLVSGLEGAVGSTVGPDGALYVAEGVAGRISRVDPRTGRRTTFAGGLPRRILDTGGAMDVAFVRNRELFGDLGDDERFADAYRSALDSLREHGARATLERLAE